MDEQACGQLTPSKGYKINPLGTLLNSVDNVQREHSVQAISSHRPIFLENTSSVPLLSTLACFSC